MLLSGLGIALVLEGLAFALAPRRLEEVAALIARLPLDLRRGIGLAAIAAGTGLVWLGGA